MRHDLSARQMAADLFGRGFEGRSVSDAKGANSLFADVAVSASLEEIHAWRLPVLKGALENVHKAKIALNSEKYR